MALTREKILETAFEVLRQFGLADLSMRRLATELGVAPGALYYHVKNKQELLGHLAARMLHKALVTSLSQGQAGADRLRTICDELYSELITIKESAEVIRLAIALHPREEGGSRLNLLDALEDEFLSLAGPSADLAARALLHLALSAIEEEQTRALLAGSTPPPSPPASYAAVVEHLIRGFTIVTPACENSLHTRHQQK